MDDFEGQKCTNDRAHVRKYVSTLGQLKSHFDMKTANGRLCNCKTAKCNKMSLDDFINKTTFESVVVTDSVIDINHQRKSITHERYSESNGRTVDYAEASKEQVHQPDVTKEKRQQAPAVTTTKIQQPAVTKEKRQQPPDLTTVDNLSTSSLAAVPVKSNQMSLSLLSILCLTFFMLI